MVAEVFLDISVAHALCVEEAGEVGSERCDELPPQMVGQVGQFIHRVRHVLHLEA